MPKVIQLVWNYESFPRMFSEQQLLCFADKSPHMMSTSFFFLSHLRLCRGMKDVHVYAIIHGHVEGAPIYCAV